MNSKTALKVVFLRVSPALWARVKARAAEEGETLQQYVTGALRAHLEAQEAFEGENTDNAEFIPLR